MHKALRFHRREITTILAAVASILVPILFSRHLFEVAPTLPSWMAAWSNLSQEARIGILAGYLVSAVSVATPMAYRAIRRLRLPPEFEKYRIYGENQDQLGSVDVTTPGGGSAHYDVIPVDNAYSKFFTKYGNLRLLRLFGKLYPIAIIADQIALRQDDVKCNLLMDHKTGQPKRFRLDSFPDGWDDELLQVHTQLRGKGFAYFDDLAKLKSCTVRHHLPSLAKRMELEFEVCNYRDYIVTNYSVDLQRQGASSVRDFVDGRGARLHGLPPLRKSAHANQLGLNAMIVTADGKMIAAARSDAEFTYPSLLGPPVSGTQMYWYRGPRKRTEADGSVRLLREPGPATAYYSGYSGEHGIPNPFAGILAQGNEEINLLPEHVRLMRLIGVNRDLTRGGLPDAFFVVHLELSYAELHSIAPEKARDSWERRKEHGLPDFGPPDIRRCSYREAAADFRAWLRRDTATPALVSGIYFFLQYFKSYSSEFQ